MLPHDEPYLFRNTATKIGYCTDELEITEWGDLQWSDPSEEKASRAIREWCERYIAAYDYHHGDCPDGE
jgi:hypothetical protein